MVEGGGWGGETWLKPLGQWLALGAGQGTGAGRGGTSPLLPLADLGMGEWGIGGNGRAGQEVVC